MNLDDLLLRDYMPVPTLRRPLTHVPRASTPAVDVHNHLGRWLGGGDWLIPDVPALLDLMDEVGVRTIVNLDGRWGAELDANIARYDPARFPTFCHLDWSLLRGTDPTGALIAGLRRSRDAGARGVKVWKDLGLSVTDASGARVLPDDPRLRDVFAAAGELGLPVLIHTADPIAFFAPLDNRNERLEELAENPSWWFGAPGHPTFDRLMQALENVVAAAPGTTFIGAHVGCAAEDLGWVDGMLTRYPNFHVDLGGRLAELGRQPRATRRLILKHPDRVLFGSDAFPPTRSAYEVYWRFLETEDECFPYAPGSRVPPQGRWDISAIGLPPEVLAQVYAGNARRLLNLAGGTASALQPAHR
ncbi:amidohydrolase family protein [Actinoplanes aureus]|uniref:Amidohydrolase family protein n=1 Tax=Actinoplanes aureus TaxID=2792083 RepID=A0A931C7U9_9ACTN|nr:amidohydrolase family protein [Actinoplanes aureus]MBG0563794.1 amidohydrolase family protein [Actinoplanes aureus]